MPEYLVKTVNYTAKIKGDEELCHLAKVGTLQKDMLVREEPGGTWMEAKNIPVLMRFWGLEPVKDSPRAIPRPDDAGTGISKMTIEDTKDSPFDFLHEASNALMMEPKPGPKVPRLKTVIDYNPFFSESLDDSEEDREVTQYIKCEECVEVPLEAAQMDDASLRSSRQSAVASSADYQVVSSSVMVIEHDSQACGDMSEQHHSASYPHVLPQPIASYQPIASHQPVVSHQPIASHQPIVLHQRSVSPQPLVEAQPVDAFDDFEAATTEPSLFDINAFVDGIVRYEKESAIPPAPGRIVDTPHDAGAPLERPPIKPVKVLSSFSDNPVAQAVADANQESAMRELEEAATSDFTEQAVGIRAWTKQKLESERKLTDMPVNHHQAASQKPPTHDLGIDDFLGIPEPNSGTIELSKKTHRIKKQRIADAARTIPRMRQNAHEIDVFLDEGDSEAFRVHSRSELDALMQAELAGISAKVEAKAKKRKERVKLEHAPGFEEEDESSDRFKIRTRAELRRLFKEEKNAGDVDSISINMPLPSTTPNQNNLRTLFEEENELHIYLASEIREKESEAVEQQRGFDSDRDRAVNVKPSESAQDRTIENKKPLVVLRDGPLPVSRAKAEDTKLTSAPSSAKPLHKHDTGFLDLLLEGENEIASFQNLCLTNERLWSVDIVKGSVQNYESYGLNSVQWVALKQEKHWEYVAINILIALGLVMAYGYFDDIVTLMVLIYALVMLPVTYVFSYRTSLQVGLGNKVVKCSQRITRDNRKRALKFLNSIERTAQSISRSDLKPKIKN